MSIFDLFKKPKKEPIQCHLQYHLAGVTFDNEDGTKRQEIIKKMKEHDKVTLERYTYNGEDALRVVNENNQCIGNIRAKEVPYVLAHFDTLIECKITDIYSFLNENDEEIYTASVIVYFWN